ESQDCSGMTHKPSLRFPPRYESARICASVKPQPAGPGAGSGGSAMRRRDVGTTTDGAELAGIGGRGRTAHPEASSGQVPCPHIPSGWNTARLATECWELVAERYWLDARTPRSEA